MFVKCDKNAMNSVINLERSIKNVEYNFYEFSSKSGMV